MIDSHAHYSHIKFDNTYRYFSYINGKFRITEGNRDGIFREMKENGVAGFIEPATDIDSNYRLYELYEKNRGFMYPAVGVHPTRTFLTEWKRRKELDALAGREGVVAIGEAGLDYHYPRKGQHRLCQRMWFAYQLSLAYKEGLPLILHIRSADKEALKMLERRRKKLHGGVVHCFCGDAETAKRYLALGLYIGVGGALLQTGADDLREAVKSIPLDRILIETDAPYVLPDKADAAGVKPTKRVRNSSTVIFAVAEEIARIKNTDAETVKKASDENVKRLFGIG